MYAFDSALLIYHSQFADGLQQFEASIGGEGTKEILRQLDSIVTEANNTFKERSEVMRGLAGGESV